MKIPTHTYIGGLFVIVDVVHIPGQTEISDLHHVVLCHQDIPGCQIPVDALKKEAEG